MANTIRIKRRAAGGAAGAPTGLANAELAYNEADDVLYYGKGSGGAGGTATTVEAIAGLGAYVGLSGTQTITGNKTFSGTLALGGSATATTQTAGNKSTSVATTAYVDGAVVAATYNFTLAGDSGTSQTIDDTETVTISGGTGLSSVASATNTITLNLDNTAVSAGSYGSASAIPTFTVDAQGRLTAAGTASISTSFTVDADSGDNLTISGGDTFRIIGGTGLTSTASATDTLTLDLDNTAVTPASYGSASSVGTFTVDAQGRLTAAASTTIEIALGTNTSGSYVATITGGTGVTSSAATTGEGTTHSLSIGQDVATSASVTFAGLTLNSGSMVFEGATANDHETTLAVTDPTADRTVTLPDATGTVALTNNKLDVFAATTSAELISVISDETGSGALVFANTPTLVTPNIGAATGTSLVLSGDLTVNGTTTTINSTTVTVDDKNLELGSSAEPTDAGADGGGITLKGTTDKTFNWVDATDAWTSSENLNLLTGKSLLIAGTSVLSGSTLGSGITASSLTSVGTIATGVWNGTAIAIANGGTGATDAGAARTALGLAIGTNVQAYDAELAALAGLTSAADALPYFTGSGAASTTTLSSFGRTLIDDADASTARTTLGLAIGTNVQAYDAELAALAGLTSAADKLPYFSGSGTAALADFSSFGRSLVDDADAAAGRTTLGLGTIATQNSNNVSITGGSIDNITIDCGTF